MLDVLSTALAATAVARDATGGPAADERQAIRDSGLLTLSLPEAQGGWGADWITVLKAVRRLARVDSALAHVLAFHHLQLATLALSGTLDQKIRHWRDTVLQQIAALPEQPELHLRPDKQVHYEAVARVLAAAQRVGLHKLGVTGNELFL